MQGLNLDIALERIADIVPLILVGFGGAIILEIVVYFVFTRVFRSRHAIPFMLVSPAVVALALFTLYPFVYNIRLAFSDLRLKTITCYIENNEITNVPCSLGQAAIGAEVDIKLDETAVRTEPGETREVAFTLGSGETVTILRRAKSVDFVTELSRPNCGVPRLSPGYNECVETQLKPWQLAQQTQDNRDWWEVETSGGDKGWIPNNTFFIQTDTTAYAENQGVGDVVTQLTAGEEVRLVRREALTWYQVRTADGQEGWIALEPQAFNLYVSAGDVVVYEAQDATSAEAATLSATSEARILRNQPIVWYTVSTPENGDGWINAEVSIQEIYKSDGVTTVFDGNDTLLPVGMLDDGDEATITATSTRTWSQVSLLDGTIGWASGATDEVDAISVPESETIFADTDSSTEQLGSVEAGEVVVLLDSRTLEDGTWNQILTNAGIEGWVQMDTPDATQITILSMATFLFTEQGGQGGRVMVDESLPESEQPILPRGTQVSLLSEGEVTWYTITFGEAQGFVSKEPAEIVEIFSTTAETPVYPAFSDTTTVIATIPAETQITVNGSQEEPWFQIQTADRTVGWVNVEPAEIQNVFSIPEDTTLFATPGRLATPEAATFGDCCSFPTADNSATPLAKDTRVEVLENRNIFWYFIRKNAPDGTISVGWIPETPREEITTERETVLYSLEYGWDNFKRVFVREDPVTGEVLGQGRLLQTENSTFVRLMQNTLIWTSLNVLFHLTFGMILALMLNKEGLKLKGLYRAIIILPWAIPQVIIALAWKGEFHSQFGFVNNLLGELSHFLVKRGLEEFSIDPINWRFETTPAFAAVTFVNIWLGIPFYMVTLLGGLQSIAGDYYEAASIDGANAFQRFLHITTPLIRPVAVPIVTLDVIWTFNNFNVIYLISEGGPNESTNILVTALYNAAFGRNGQFQLGFSAAFSLVIFAVLFLFAIVWVGQSGALKGIYDK